MLHSFMGNKVNANDITPALIAPAIAVQSDSLSTLREIILAFPIIAKHLGAPESVRLVLDANVLVAEVRWLVKKRKQPDARTALQEALESGTLVAFAPTFLEEEMQTQLAALAEEEALCHASLTAEWAEYRKRIAFYEATRPPERSALSADGDPKDIPYIETYLAVGAAAIMTSDRHLARMGAKTIGFEFSVHMRQYARDASIDFTLRWHGILLELASAAVVIGIVRGGVEVARMFNRLPPEIIALVLGLVTGALLYRPTRDRIVSGLRGGREALAATLNEVLPVVGQLMRLASDKGQSAAEAWSKMPLTTHGHIPLAVQVLAVCIAANRPLTSEEIRLRLAASGARTTAKSFPSYLRRVLRNHRGLISLADGRWELVPRATGSA